MSSPIQLEPGKARWKFNPKLWDSKSIVAEPKYDGSRYLMHVGIGESRFTSRHISKKDGNFVEKTSNVPHLRDILAQNGLDTELEGTIFDGEIVVPNNVTSKSMDVTKIMGSLPERAIKTQNDNGWLDYYVFDVIFDKGQDIRHLPYQERRAILVGYLGSIANPKIHLNITPVEAEDKERFYQDIIEAGGEGVILKDIKAPYGKNWAKVKRSSTWDVIITGFKEPKEITKKVTGEESTSRFFENGWIGALEFGQYVDGVLTEFGFCSGIDDALREKISNNRNNYLGSVIEITAQERLPSGKFRHPRFLRFRPDKNASQCVYRPDEV